MMRRYKIIIAILLGIAVLVPSILVYASVTKAYFFSRDLIVGEFVASGDSYLANVMTREFWLQSSISELNTQLPTSAVIKCCFQSGTPTTLNLTR